MKSTTIIASGIFGASLLTGCVQSIPADPEGTLEEVRGGALHVGLTPNAGFVEKTGDNFQGSDVDLVQGFAERLGAKVQWKMAGEEQLVADLELGNLDLVTGGFSSDTPWSEQVGITRPYTTFQDQEGKEDKAVLLVPPGENAFLFELESYLDQTQEMP